MSPSDEQARVVREGFVRQRRSLIAVSLGLLWYLSSGIRLSTITLLGNSFAIERPALVPAAMWLAWGYFLLRFYQHLRDLDDAGWSSAVGVRVNLAARTLAHQTLLRTLRIDQPAADNLSIGPMDVVETPTHWLLTAGGSFTVEEGGSQVTHLFREKRIPVARSALRLPTVRAWFWTALHTRHFTEYALPFVIAISPIAWLVWRRISTM